MKGFILTLAAFLVFTSHTFSASSAVRYQLLDSSSLLDDCPVCGRPTISKPLRGSFDLRLVQSTPLSSLYQVENINFRAGSGTNVEEVITGEGNYEIGGEVALRQQMELITDVNGNSLTFTNEDAAVSRRWPIIEVSVVQTQRNLFKEYTLNILAAPVRELWFSTVAGFTSASGAIVGPGDLISMEGRIVKSNTALMQNLGFMPVVGHIPIDGVEMAPGGEVLFSFNHDQFSETLGRIGHGDVVSARGSITLRNSDALAAFGIRGAPDYGLKGLTKTDAGHFLFAINSNVFSPKLNKTLQHGDILSTEGVIVMSNAQLLAGFRPPQQKDYGLSAFYRWPHDEIWFAVEEGFTDARFGQISPGDILSSEGYLVWRNADLARNFAPGGPPVNYGFDALYVVTDTQPPAAPPEFSSIRSLSNRQIVMEWTGAGRVFQLERNNKLAGTWQRFPISPDTTHLEQGSSRAFFKVRQW